MPQISDWQDGFLRGAASDSFTMKGNVTHGMKFQFNKLETDFTRSHVNRWYQIQVAKITITFSNFAFCLLRVCVCFSPRETDYDSRSGAN